MSIIKGLFIGLKNLKVVPFNRMTPELHDELGSNLAKVMMVAKMSNARLTKAQREYIVNQAKQLQEFEDRYITGIKDKSGNVIKSDEGIKNTESAKIFNLQGEKLDSSKPIVGGSQSGKKINREFFERNAEAKEVQKRIDSGVATTVEKMLGMKPIDAMKEANLVIGRKGQYKNLSQEDAKKILQDTEDHIFERNIKPKETDMDFDDNDFADGGRIGFFMGGPNPRGLGLLKQILNYMSKKGIETGKFQGVDLSALDMLRLSNPKRFNKLLADVRGKVNIKEGIMGTDTVRAQQLALREQRKALTEKSLDVAKAMKKDQDKIAKRIDEEAEKTIIPQIKKQLMEGIGMSEEAAEKTAKNMAEVAKNMKPLNAPPEIIDEGLLQLENVLKNLKTGGKKKRELNATGGRIGLKDGMDRRTFMKIMAGLASIPVVGKVFKGAKVASKAAPVVKEAVTSGGTPPPYFFNLVKKIKNLGDDVTEKQAIKEREIVTEYKDYKLTEDLDTGELTIQKTSIDGDFDTPVPTAEEVYMQYKPGKGQVDEATGAKVADEYVEDTSYVGTSRDDKGEIVNTVDGVPDEVIQEGTVFEDNVADFIIKEAQSIKKAGGGIARMLGE